MEFIITALYAAIFGVLALVLSNIVSAQRAKANISIMHGDNMQLALWIRRHGNLVETIPLALILMGLSETLGMPAMWLHAMGLLLLASRLIHVVGLNTDRPAAPLRIIGGSGTQLAMLGAIGYIFWKYFF